jgi:aldehyde:ferredoxin oxidoreductase
MTDIQQTYSPAPAATLPGYMGKLLRVDLSTGALWDEPLNASYAAAFVGGSGLATRYLWEMLTSETAPLGPENPLIFMTGPLVGSSTPAAGRFAVAARSPATGLLGEANSGGYWGPELKRSGYDGLIITGQAAGPVWLSLQEGQPPTLHDARALWGLDLYETQEAIREALGDKRVRVACIGPAGENQVLFAGVMNDHGRAAARTGLGAVMGSKMLKAIAVRGRARAQVADVSQSKRAAKALTEHVTEDLTAQMIRLGGTLLNMDLGPGVGDVPAFYYATNVLNDIDDSINAGALSDHYLTRHVPCFRCPIACGREIRLPQTGDAVIDGPEYETAVSFGPIIGSDDLAAAAYAGHLCNRFGLDTISTGSTIALAYQLFAEGVITASDTGGLKLVWGDAQPAILLIEQIAYRQGFGDLLAQGAARVAAHFGVPQQAIHAKMLELPYHDVHAYAGQGVVYATSPRGADHMAGDVYHWEMGNEIPELAIGYGDPQDESAEKMAMVARIMDFRALTNSLIICHFADTPVPQLLAMMAAVTGQSWTVARLQTTGARIFELKRLLNARLGATPAHDALPARLLRAYEKGPTAGYAPDLATMLRHYYAARQWDAITGVATPARLAELGLA